MSRLNWTWNTVSGASSRSPSIGSEKATTGGRLGRGGGGGVGLGRDRGRRAGRAASTGSTSIASSVTTRLRTRTRPMICSHLPVSRFRLASRLQPEPLGFFPVTQTANTSSLITQSDERSRLDDGRSPNRFSPRNSPRTFTVLPS